MLSDSVCMCECAHAFVSISFCLCVHLNVYLSVRVGGVSVSPCLRVMPPSLPESVSQHSVSVDRGMYV